MERIMMPAGTYELNHEGFTCDVRAEKVWKKEVRKVKEVAFLLTRSRSSTNVIVKRTDSILSLRWSIFGAGQSHRRLGNTRLGVLFHVLFYLLQ